MEKNQTAPENTFLGAETLAATTEQTVVNEEAEELFSQEEEDLEPKIAFKNQTILGQEVLCEAKTDLLKIIDTICESNQLKYFAFANLLISCVHYQDFLPGEAAREWEIGLLREDYEKLISILRTYSFEPGVRFTESGKNKIPRKFVLLEKVVEVKGEEFYATKLVHIRIAPFDRLPEAYDTRVAFIKKIRKQNEIYNKISSWRSFNPRKHRMHQYAFYHFYYGKRSLEKQKNKIIALSQEYNQDNTAQCVSRLAFNFSKKITMDQLFPLKRLPFRDMTIPCPNDYTVWTPTIDEALEYQVKSIQKADLVILKKFDEICRKLNLGYFVCGGTMLGYMRHGGFIPWDDDVDVAMLREDYNRFLKEAGPLLDDRFFLQTRESDPGIPYLFSKIRLNNTEYITAYNENRDYHKGLCLDIFPFDYIPNDPKEQKQFKEEVLKLSAKHNKIANNQIPEPVDEVKPRNLKEKWYHLVQKTTRWYYHHRSLKKSQEKYISKATKFNDSAKQLGLTTVASFVPSYTYIRCEDLLPYQDAEFNGVRVMVPKDPDVFLKMQYGDYMQLPPKHLQVAHKLLRWSADIDTE